MRHALTATWGGLAAAVLATAAVAPAQEKTPAPVTAPAPAAAVVDKSGAVVVPIGGQVRFKMKSGKAVRSTNWDNERILQVLEDALDPKFVILNGRAAGTTRLELTDADGKKEEYLILVQRDLEMFRNLIKRTVPTAAVEVIPIGDAGTGVVLTGHAASTDDVTTINELARALGLVVSAQRVVVGGGGMVPHVQLDVVLANVNRSKARTRGFNFIVNGSTVSFGSILGGLTSLTPGTSQGATQAVGLINVAPTVSASSAPNLIFGVIPANFQGLLQALKTEGLAKLISAPQAVCRSGEVAEMLIGGRQAVLSASSGITGPGVTYEDVGTELRFLPVVYGNGKISLTVRPRVRAVNAALGITTSFGTVPGFDEQRIETSIIMEPGQTFAIGGLIQSSLQSSVTKVPVLGELPFVGALFSQSSQSQQEQELVILVTAHLVDPMDCNQVPKRLPGAETRSPDDFEFYLEGMLELPRGSRLICDGNKYKAGWKNDPTADKYPCAGLVPQGAGAGGKGACGPAGAVGCATCAPGKGTLTPPPTIAPSGPASALPVSAPKPAAELRVPPTIPPSVSAPPPAGPPLATELRLPGDVPPAPAPVTPVGLPSFRDGK